MAKKRINPLFIAKNATHATSGERNKSDKTTNTPPMRHLPKPVHNSSSKPVEKPVHKSTEPTNTPVDKTVNNINTHQTNFPKNPAVAPKKQDLQEPHTASKHAVDKPVNNASDPLVDKLSQPPVDKSVHKPRRTHINPKLLGNNQNVSSARQQAPKHAIHIDDFTPNARNNSVAPESEKVREEKPDLFDAIMSEFDSEDKEVLTQQDTEAEVETEATMDEASEVEEVTEPSNNDYDDVFDSILDEISTTDEVVEEELKERSDAGLEENGDTDSPESSIANIPVERIKGRKVSSRFTADLPVYSKAESTVSEDTTPKTKQGKNRYNERNPSMIETPEDFATAKTAERGFGAEGNAHNARASAKNLVITPRDMVMLKFLSRYRYAFVDMLARLTNSSSNAINQRLRILERHNIVRKEPIMRGVNVWLITRAGNVFIDSDLSPVKEGSINPINIAHTIGLANLGVELERSIAGDDNDPSTYVERAGLNILGESDYPHFYRWKDDDPFSGVRALGEITVTEREIRQSQMRFRGTKTGDDMRKLVDLAVINPDAPELEAGNEAMFVVYGTYGRPGEHVPDLIVARPRDEQGNPQHIAIELELNAKKTEEWRRILQWYKDNGNMYSKVYYFTHKASIWKTLLRVDQSVGLGNRLVIRKYTPSNSSNKPFWG